MKTYKQFTEDQDTFDPMSYANKVVYHERNAGIADKLAAANRGTRVGLLYKVAAEKQRNMAAKTREVWTSPTAPSKAPAVAPYSSTSSPLKMTESSEDLRIAETLRKTLHSDEKMSKIKFYNTVAYIHRLHAKHATEMAEDNVGTELGDLYNRIASIHNTYAKANIEARDSDSSRRRTTQAKQQKEQKSRLAVDILKYLWSNRKRTR